MKTTLRNCYVKIFLMWACAFAWSSAAGQYTMTISKNDFSPIPGAVCPLANVGTSYSVNTPSDFAGCAIEWSAENGDIFNGVKNQSTVGIIWRDIPGAIGKATAKFSGCTNTAYNKSTSKSETILSVNNQTWTSSLTNKTLDFCSTGQLQITVPHMYVSGTGGIAQPPSLEAFYAWTLPAGWVDVNTGSATPNTTLNFITIKPTGCTRKGQVKVAATLKGAGVCENGANSASLTLDINVAEPVPVVQAESSFLGYTTACAKTPVVFSLTTSPNIGCNPTYTWGPFPAGWKEQPGSRINNTITLIPTGDQTDNGTITGKITFGCGTTLTATYTAAFKAPSISLSSLKEVCYSIKPNLGTAVTISNLASSTPVNWTVTDGLNILSGAGTPNIVLGATSSSTSKKATITATLPTCSYITFPSKDVWAGRPYALVVSGSAYVEPGSYNNYSMAPVGSTATPPTPSFDFQGVDLVTEFSWALGMPATSVGWDCGGCYGPYTTFKAGQYSTYVTANAKNRCGTTTANYPVQVHQTNCPPGGCVEPFFTYPNPTSQGLTIIPSLQHSSTIDLNVDHEPLINLNAQQEPTIDPILHHNQAGNFLSNPTGSSSITEVLLLDGNGNIVFKWSGKTTDRVDVPLEGFENGHYYLKYKEDDVTKTHHILIRH